MDIATKLTQIAEKEAENIELNNQLAEGLYGNEEVKSYYDEFWDIVQDYGNRTNYAFAFSSDMWTQENFKPKYPIKMVGSAGNSFAYWGQNNGSFYKERIDLRGVCTFDLSECTSLNNMFYLNQCVYAIGTLDLRNIEVLQNVFNSAYNLEIIEKIILREDGTQTLNNICRGCSSLKNLVISGIIGNDIDFQWSKMLTKDSIKGKLATEEEIAMGENLVAINNKMYYGGIITALSDTQGATLTLSKVAVDNAFETSERAADGSTSDEWLNLIASKANKLTINGTEVPDADRDTEKGLWTIALV